MFKFAIWYHVQKQAITHSHLLKMAQVRVQGLNPSPNAIAIGLAHMFGPEVLLQMLRRTVEHAPEAPPYQQICDIITRFLSQFETRRNPQSGRLDKRTAQQALDALVGVLNSANFNPQQNMPQQQPPAPPRQVIVVSDDEDEEDDGDDETNDESEDDTDEDSDDPDSDKYKNSQYKRLQAVKAGVRRGRGKDQSGPKPPPPGASAGKMKLKKYGWL